MTRVRRLRFAAACALALAAVPLGTASATPPNRVTDPVPDPGKGIASADDTSAIAVNPANLGFLPSWELRWNTVWTGDLSPLPNRGHSFAFGIPVWVLASGLRVDALDPPASAPAPFDANSHWIRWAFAAHAGEAFSVGTTLGWGLSSEKALNGEFSLTSGLTIRMFPWISLAVVARDWNGPVSEDGTRTERRFDVGFAVRPFASNVLELGFEAELYAQSKEWVPRGVLGLSIPRFGRLRADVSMLDPDKGRRFLATTGLDMNLGFLQLSGGGVYGDAITRSGTGFYAGAAIRGFREYGVQFPARIAKLKIHDVPSVRGHTRLLRRLWRIAENPEIEGVALMMRAEPASSLAHAEEVADAIRLIRARGKKVLCHLEDASGKALFVCSQANRIVMNPAGGLRFAGIASQYYYFGGLLKKLGVRADFVRIGDHKGAAEQLTNSGGSEVARLDHQEQVEEFEKVYLDIVGGGRQIPVRTLKARLAAGPFVASEARDSGLIDGLAYEDELERVVAEMMGTRSASIVDDEPEKQAPRQWGDVGRVGVVYLSGDMVDGDSQYIPIIGIRLAGAQTIARALRRMREDRSVKSVVFRVETGGGSSLAADVILREAILLARKKPLLVSMGSSAASGGYYASVAAREIFANRSTITGSIGIFYGKVDVTGLLDKLGVRVEQYRSSPRADADSFFRPFTDDEHRKLGSQVKQGYDLFIGRVSEGRHMRADAVDAVARGKVWTGQQAATKGLVDCIGGLRQALAEARVLGGVSQDAPLYELPDDDESILGFLLNLAGLSAFAAQSSVIAAIPPAFLQMARALAPFMVFDSSKPLARAEFVEDELPSKD